MSKKVDKPRVSMDVEGLTEGDVTKFLESPVWKRMEQHLVEKVQSAYLLLENAPVDDQWETNNSGELRFARSGFRRLQGEILGAKFALSLPASYLDELKEDKDNE